LGNSWEAFVILLLDAVVNTKNFVSTLLLNCKELVENYKSSLLDEQK
jgi:hypothetical protein